ncbi:hypothetical protein TWF694_006946 [Orbilia ellipsospora]|uniref:Uncharacterized protein n=1 Tax=Orbilia ellipsospora TaxID=2528407 RepID=A0AAV9XM29_9PEZI
MRIIDPMQPVRSDWWHHAHYLNRIRRAVLRKEYDTLVDDDNKLTKRNLIAEFKEINVDELICKGFNIAEEQLEKDRKDKKRIYQVILKARPRIQPTERKIRYGRR